MTCPIVHLTLTLPEPEIRIIELAVGPRGQQGIQGIQGETGGLPGGLTATISNGYVVWRINGLFKGRTRLLGASDEDGLGLEGGGALQLEGGGALGLEG